MSNGIADVQCIQKTTCGVGMGLGGREGVYRREVLCGLKSRGVYGSSRCGNVSPYTMEHAMDRIVPLSQVLLFGEYRRRIVVRVSVWFGRRYESCQSTMISDENDECFNGTTVSLKNTKCASHIEDESWYGYACMCGWMCLWSIQEWRYGSCSREIILNSNTEYSTKKCKTGVSCLFVCQEGTVNNGGQNLTSGLIPGVNERTDTWQSS